MAKKHNMLPLIVFAKVPTRGTVKTRIAATEGADRAYTIYLELLQQTARNVAHLSYHVAFTGQKDPGDLKKIFNHAVSFFPQSGGTLGERMSSAFSELFAAGHDAAVLIGCDIPAITPSILDSACTALEDAEVVIGPAEDGGYYLIGCRTSSLAVFAATTWGKESLFEDTLAIIRQNGFRHAQLPVLYDIDGIDDYYRWKKG